MNRRSSNTCQFFIMAEAVRNSSFRQKLRHLCRWNSTKQVVTWSVLKTLKLELTFICVKTKCLSFEVQLVCLAIDLGWSLYSCSIRDSSTSYWISTAIFFGQFYTKIVRSYGQVWIEFIIGFGHRFVAVFPWLTK